MASQNLNVGTAANANDGDTLRAAFINVRKMFHEIYGISATYSDSLDLSTGGETFAESVQDIIGGMVSGNTEDNIQVTYDDTNNKLNFSVAADINDINTEANSGLSGGVDSGDATLTLDLNNLSAGVVDVAADSIAIVDANDSNNTKKESIADVMTAVAGSGLTATSGVLSVDSIGTDGITNDAVTPPKLDQFDDSLTAATSGDILVSNGTDFIHATMSGDATIASGGALSLANDIVDHDELADRYTEVQTISTTTATVNLDASSYTVFNITANLQSTQTLNIQNMKTGQVIDILATGTSTLTLTSDDTSETFNNLGAVTYDGSSNNHIQIICIDDTDSAAIYNYTIQTYTSDNTPN